MYNKTGFVLACLGLVAMLALTGCGGSSRVDEVSENVGPGPGVAMINHSGITGWAHLPYWELYVGGALFTWGSNLLQDTNIFIDLTGVPVGTACQVFGFDLDYDQITYAENPMGPMGVVLQMP